MDWMPARIMGSGYWSIGMGQPWHWGQYCVHGGMRRFVLFHLEIGQNDLKVGLFGSSEIDGKTTEW